MSNNDSGRARPLIYAHRGSSMLAPENTLEAYLWSLEQGADVLETDIRISADGCLFMFHDETLERTTNGSGRFIDADSAQLKTLDASCGFLTPEATGGDNQGNRFPANGLQHIELLTLQELFEALPSTWINIDIKDDLQTAADALIRLIQQYDRVATTTVGSFHKDVMLYLRQQAPEIRTAALKNEVMTLYFERFNPFRRQPTSSHAQQPVVIPPTAAFHALQIPVQWRGIQLATPTFVNHVQRLGYEVVFWTVNDEATLVRLAELGVDGVVTDLPGLARDIFGR